MKTTSSNYTGVGQIVYNEKKHPRPAITASAEIAQNTLTSARSSSEERRMALRERITELEKNVTEKDAEITGLKNQIEQMVHTHSAEIKDLEIRAEKKEDLSETCEELTAAFLKCKEDLKNTQIENAELIDQIKGMHLKMHDATPDFATIWKPTANELSKQLADLIPILNSVSTLKKEIDELRSEAQITCKIIKRGEETIDILKQSLKINDPGLERLIQRFLELEPVVLKAQEDLQKMKEEATHKAIPEEHIKAISAKNFLPMSQMKSNDEAFEKLLKNLEQTLTLLKADWDHIRLRYEDVTGHLNQIDNQLGWKQSNSLSASIPLIRGTVNYQSKTRVSPTSPSYVRPLTTDSNTAETKQASSTVV